MPIATTKKAAQTVQRRIRKAAQQVRDGWTGREQRQRRLEAFRMQGQLARVLEPAPVSADR